MKTFKLISKNLWIEFLEFVQCARCAFGAIDIIVRICVGVPILAYLLLLFKVYNVSVITTNFK